MSASPRSNAAYRLEASLTLPGPLERVFAFFADAANLEAITPPRLRLTILSPLPIEMRPGARIDYRVRVLGVPVRWQSEITVWEPPHRFVDEQRRGPYRFWRHEHRFAVSGDGVRAEDRVDYAVPGGRAVHGLLVRRDLLRIFGFRQAELDRRLGPAARPLPPVEIKAVAATRSPA